MFPRCSLILNRVGGLSAAWNPTMSALTLQCVRWRKRRTDPIAKSKINYKRIPTPIDPWEYDFLNKKTSHYRTLIKAIKKMFQEEQAQKKTETAEGGSAEERAQTERHEHLRILEWNDQENARTRAMREERLKAEALDREEKKLERLLQMEEQRRQRLEELAERVQQEKEASKHYITMDSVERVIEESLANPKEYNFSIGKRGEILLPKESAWEDLKARQELESENAEETLQEKQQEQ